MRAESPLARRTLKRAVFDGHHHGWFEARDRCVVRERFGGRGHVAKAVLGPSVAMAAVVGDETGPHRALGRRLVAGV